MAKRSKRSSKSSNEADLVNALLASRSVDEIAAYVASGRRHASLQNEDLFEAWKSALRAMAEQPHLKMLRDKHTYLSAEIRLRGLEEPSDSDILAVRVALGSKIAERLKDPDARARLKENLLKEIEEFELKRNNSN